MAQPNPSWLAAALGEQDTAAVAPTQYTSPSADEDTEQDDDDIGFDPTQDTEDLDDDDDDDDDDEEDGEYLDAEEILEQFETTEDDETEQGDDNDEGDDGPAVDLLDLLSEAAGGAVGDEGTAQVNNDRPREIRVTQTELLRLIRQTGAGGLERLFGAINNDNDEIAGFPGLRVRRRKDPYVSDFPPVPSPYGCQLMESGVFGTHERHANRIRKKKKLAARIMRRELGLDSSGGERSSTYLARQGMIPSSKADTIIHHDSRCESGQFSDDGNFFFSCSQDFTVRMYNTSNPYEWKYYKSVIYPYGQWKITDASLSPDNKWLAYSSIKSTVCLAATDPDNDSQPYLLDFAAGAAVGRRQVHNGFGGRGFGIWSIRFSGDGREIVAGTSSNSVVVYDLETSRSILNIRGHEEDVNAVCFGDKSSPHLLYSGSDDSTIKIWDRRSMSDSREAGCFLGHTEGLTYVDSKGDGRYVLSNGKDQTMRLWDLRKMLSTEATASMNMGDVRTDFDYRFELYNTKVYRKHPHDCSIVTFRGHKVLKTLIRCHFSPPGSTDSRYVYSGSEDGSVYIYNLDATLAGKVNVQAATQNTRPSGDEDGQMMDFYNENGNAWKTCVRDASWHPNAPVIAATSWNGRGMTQGTCTVHSWNDGVDEDEAEPRMGLRVDPELRPNQRLYQQQVYRRPTTRGVFRRHNEDEEA